MTSCTSYEIRDPRSVARNASGIIDLILPRLNSGIVGLFNKRSFSIRGINPVPEDIISGSNLPKSILFETAFIHAESALTIGVVKDWQSCFMQAVRQQRQFFGQNAPTSLTQLDINAACLTANNLIGIMSILQARMPDQVFTSKPNVPGLGWIASGAGDFAIGEILVEVKNTDRGFTAGDIRQVFIYMLLSYASSIEIEAPFWTSCLLVNSRRARCTMVKFDEVLKLAADEVDRVGALELLRSVIGQENERR